MDRLLAHRQRHTQSPIALNSVQRGCTEPRPLAGRRAAVVPSSGSSDKVLGVQTGAGACLGHSRGFSSSGPSSRQRCEARLCSPTNSPLQLVVARGQSSCPAPAVLEACR